MNQEMKERVGFRAGQVVLVLHSGRKIWVQIRSIRADTIATWIVYFVGRLPYRCPAKVARPVF